MSVAAPRGDMDGSRSKVTDISESCRREEAYLREQFMDLCGPACILPAV